jgi:hypothetical protein
MDGTTIRVLIYNIFRNNISLRTYTINPFFLNIMYLTVYYLLNEGLICSKRSPRSLLRAELQVTLESEALATEVDSTFVTFQTLGTITYVAILSLFHIHSSSTDAI